MAQPSSSHREHDSRDRTDRHDRTHRSERSAHHHRTVSSTTLLLVLSLILAVLAVMLSLPASSNLPAATTDESKTGLWGLFSPKRSNALIARETAVAMREADVARREAELLLGAPGGVLPNPSQITCPACPTVELAPIQTVIKEVVKETEALAPSGWWKEANSRAEEILDRELKIADREREISKREEAANRREHDASRREAWIMEQLIALGNDNPQTVEEEYVYEPASRGRKPSNKYQDLPPLIITDFETETHTVTQVSVSTVTVPPPANTRIAAFPTPNVVSSYATSSAPRTTSVDIIRETVVDDEDDDEEGEYTMVRKPSSRRPPQPSKWFGGW